MALGQIINSGEPLKQRGQGAAEAILALPVFLTLICIIFQLFLLGIAQVQLQYAAFYAARAGLVNGSNKTVMNQTVRKILAKSPGVSLPEGSFHVQVTETRNNNDNTPRKTESFENRVLEVRVHWNYPLIIPLVDVLSKRDKMFPETGRNGIHLHASWAAGANGSIPRDESNASD